jgi:hypothetical protein
MPKRRHTTGSLSNASVQVLEMPWTVFALPLPRPFPSQPALHQRVLTDAPPDCQKATNMASPSLMFGTRIAPAWSALPAALPSSIQSPRTISSAHLISSNRSPSCFHIQHPGRWTAAAAIAPRKHATDYSAFIETCMYCVPSCESGSYPESNIGELHGGHGSKEATLAHDSHEPSRKPDP